MLKPKRKKANALAKTNTDWSTTIQVAKVDPDQRLIFGWASVAQINGKDVIDKQGDIIPVDELERGAYEFTLYQRTHGDMHSKIGTGHLVESMVFTAEKAALGVTAKNEKGETVYGWWAGFKVASDDLWAAHRRGERPEFSIGGRARAEQA